MEADDPHGDLGELARIALVPAGGDGNHAAIVADAQSREDADCHAELEAIVAVVHGAAKNAYVNKSWKHAANARPCQSLAQLRDDAKAKTAAKDSRETNKSLNSVSGTVGCGKHIDGRTKTRSRPSSKQSLICVAAKPNVTGLGKERDRLKLNIAGESSCEHEVIFSRVRVGADVVGLHLKVSKINMIRSHVKVSKVGTYIPCWRK